MAAHVPSSTPLGPDDGPSTRVPQWFVWAVIGLLVATLVAVLVLLARDDDQAVETVTTTSTIEDTSSTDTTAVETTSTETTATTVSTSAETTTTEATTTTTDTAPSSTVPDAYATAVWPWFGSDTSYDDPRDAAEGFATDFLDLASPVVGEFQQGDTRSGEVEIQPTPNGPVTTVFVRQLGADDTWWVLGAATAEITVTSPDALCEVTSPLTVAGESLSFEGVIEVQVRVDGEEEPLATTTVIGGGSEMAPFTGEVTFDTPDSGSGAVVFLSRSGRDGAVWQASVVRVAFGTGGC